MKASRKTRGSEPTMDDVRSLVHPVRVTDSELRMLREPVRTTILESRALVVRSRATRPLLEALWDGDKSREADLLVVALFTGVAALVA